MNAASTKTKAPAETIKYHPLSNVFPLMEGDEFQELVSNIKANGLLEPICLHTDGRILDGRNRYRACKEAGVQPIFSTWKGEGGSIVDFVVGKNICRRHLTSSQRAMVALDILPYLEKEANKRRLGTLNQFSHLEERGNEIIGNTAVSSPECQLIDTRGPGRATSQAAELVGTNRQYVADAKKIKDRQPDLAERIRKGEVTITQAKQLLKEADREALREENKRKVQITKRLEDLGGVFSTILIDPPWDFHDECDGDCDYMGRSYPTYSVMSFKELLKFPVGAKAAENSHIYVWSTDISYYKALHLIEVWGFIYKNTLTWCKPSIGLGSYFRHSTEHVLFGVRGSLPLKRHDVGTWFQAPRGPKGHSSKPVEFYGLVESCSPGSYLEIFARSERPGWTSWGGEVESSRAGS